MSITIFLLLLGLITLPLFHWEVPKVWVYLRFIEVLFVVSFFNLNKEKILIKIKNKKIVIVLIIFLLISILSSFLGSDVGKSFWGNYYRADGLITFSHLLAFSILIGSIYNKKWNIPVAIGIFLGSVVSSIFNYFGQKNFLAGFILISIPFGIYLYKSTNNKFLQRLIVLGFIIQVIRMFLTSSIVGILGLVILYPIWKLTDRKKLNITLILVITALIITTVGMWFDRRLKEKYEAESRIRIYRNVYLGSLKKPILGYGWANTDYAFESIIYPLKFNNDVYVDKAHGLFLEIFATTGVLGLIPFLIFLFLIFKKLIKRKDIWSKVLLTSFILYLIYSQTNVTSISYEFIFWLIVGIILSF